MTPSEIDNTPAGREMDALVAEKVMGELCICGIDRPFSIEGCRLHLPKNYSTDISPAWEVVSHFTKLSYDIKIASAIGGWHCELVGLRSRDHSYANSVALAVSRTSLKAVL